MRRKLQRIKRLLSEILSLVFQHKKTPSHLGFAYMPACTRIFSQLSNELPHLRLITPSKQSFFRLERSGLKDIVLSSSILTSYLYLFRFSLSKKKPTFLAVLNSKGPLEHKKGLVVTMTAKRLGYKTICIQHGGSKRSSLNHLANTASDSIATWNKAASEFCRQQSPLKEIIEIGYPFSRRLTRCPKEPYILLATCLHTEYGANRTAYQQFINDIYVAIRNFDQPIKIIPHPHDNPHDYKKLLNLNHCELLNQNLETFYTHLNACKILLTRASTAAEEAWMIRTPAILYDTPPFAARLDYSLLMGRRGIYFCEGKQQLLKVLEQAWNQASTNEYADPINSNLNLLS